MNALQDFDQRIRDTLTICDNRRQKLQEEFHHDMLDMKQRGDAYRVIASQFMEKVILPRMSKLAEHFDNAKLLDQDGIGPSRCICKLDPTSRFPANASLELSVTHDWDYEHVVLEYTLRIVPTFFRFRGSDQLCLPVAEATEEKVTIWVESQIMVFLGDYLQLESVEQYQRDNIVQDPVCGMTLNKNHAAAQADYQGRRFYFCVDDCRRKFAESPDQYTSGKSKPERAGA